MTTILIRYFIGVVVAYVLGAIWNDFIQPKLKLYSWNIYPTLLSFLSWGIVFVGILFCLAGIFGKLFTYFQFPKKPTFKIKKKKQ